MPWIDPFGSGSSGLGKYRTIPAMTIALGCIADDFTGATDLANNLVRSGMRVMLTTGIPDAPVEDVDAIVVALKSRTIDPQRAVDMSLAAARWLQAQGVKRTYFKVCSTFDSTPHGNIGPVTEALMGLLQAPFVPVTPAFPEAGRTIFNGHLFVGDQLLSDSPMRNHPLTPMTDANLVRVLQAQLRARRVGLINHATVALGGAAIAERAHALTKAGCAVAIVDAVDDQALQRLAAACSEWPLVVAGSGLGLALARRLGFTERAEASALPVPSGTAAIISGSCSAATNAQVANFMARGGQAYRVDAMRLASGEDCAAAALDWASERLGADPILVYATAAPDVVAQAQSNAGAHNVGERVEAALATVASGLVARGVRRLVVAGGETSGACVNALGIDRLRVGLQIAPGVPWCHSQNPDLHISLKSGNFGGPDFFHDAFAVLNRGSTDRSAKA